MAGTPWGDVDSLRTRRLRPGRGSSREATEASQRERLFTALVALADERGYHALRVEDLTTLAGVSRGAFYAQFRSKDDCLLATLDALVELVSPVIAAAAARERSPEGQLGAALTALMEAIAAQPAASRLVLVDAYGAGDTAIERVERGVEPLRGLLTRATGASLPPTLVEGLAGGLRRIAITRLHERREHELPALVPELTSWMLSYGSPPAILTRDSRPRGTRQGNAAFAARDQAERIMLATLAAVAEKGYAAATIADIATHAATSTRTFYAEFDDKQDAYLSALDFARVHAYAAALASSRRATDWPGAVRAGLQGLCGFLAAEQAIASATVVGPYGAGAPALERHDRAIRSFTRTLVEPADERTARVAPLVADAIGGAVDALLFGAIRDGGGAHIRAIEPVAAYIALTPFVGRGRAAEIALAAGPPRRRRA